MTVPIISWQLSDYVGLLGNGKPFTIGKFGDGELACMFKVLGPEYRDAVAHFGDSNRDGHEYFVDLGEAFHESFINEKGYIKVTSPHWIQWHQPTARLFQKYVEEYKLDVSKMRIHRHEWLYDSAQNGQLGILKDQLEKMNFVWVADPRKQNLNIKKVGYIPTPSVNSWLDKDNIMEQMIDMTEKYDTPVFCMATGMPTMAIQDILFPEIGDRCFMINVGSTFDPFVGIHSRENHAVYQRTSL